MAQRYALRSIHLDEKVQSVICIWNSDLLIFSHSRTKDDEKKAKDDEKKAS